MKAFTGQVLTDIKKALYKEKPIANCFMFGEKNWLYDCMVKDNVQVFFRVPKSEMGEKEFDPKIQAQLLIRWITDYDILSDNSPFDI